jgi:hypothetical protein
VKLISSAEESSAPTSSSVSKRVVRLRRTALGRKARMTVSRITPKRLTEIPGATPQNKKSAAKTVMRHPVMALSIIRGEPFDGSGGGNIWFIDGFF